MVLCYDIGMNDQKLYFKFKIDVLAALNEKGINFYTCRKDGTFSQGTLTHLRKGENISLNTAAKICSILQCELSDIIEIIPDSDISD